MTLYAAALLLVLLVVSPVTAYAEPPASWKAYEYIGPGADAMHPVSVEPDCTFAELAAPISSTDAQWAIDWPESPDSILPLLTYRVSNRLDLRGAMVSVRLRGEGLDLKGGHATFWILDDWSRWHLDVPLAVTAQSTSWTLDLAGPWHRSWTRNTSKPAPELEQVISYGVAFVGFSGEVTGRLVLEDLVFSGRC